MAGPIEVKVSAATIASALTGLGLWALQTYVFNGDIVPPAVEAAMLTVVPAIVTFAAGYLAPHTPRPESITQADVADAHVQDDDPGRHARDGDAGELPVVNFTRRKTPRRRD